MVTEASFHIVGCVFAARPAAEQIDAFVTQVRRERAAVLARSAQSATFVRFNALDAKLVTMACRALREPGAAPLRFGFAAGHEEAVATTGPQEGLDVSTRSVVHAGELAAGAEDGEVLVSPQLAAMLIEAGFALRSRQLALPGGRRLAACTLDLGVAREPARANAPVRSRAKKASPARQSPGLAPLAPAEEPEPEEPTPPQADALAGVFAALLTQAEEVARRQADLEARQDAVLGKMTLVDEGTVSVRHGQELEAELEAQLARVHERLQFIDKLEQRVGNIQTVVADVERRLSAQLSRRSEVESLKALCDALVDQMVDAHQRLEGVSAMQQRLLPLTTEANALAQTLEASQQALAKFEGRFADLTRGAEAAEQKMAALAERDALLQAVRTEVDALRQIGERSRADVQFVIEHEGAISGLRSKVEDLAGRVEDTDAKIATIEARRKMVEEVQSHTSSITHLLGDIQLKLEILGEQRAEIDHVGDQLARLDFTVQEAQNTLRALQREREVAERIEQGIKALRSRSSTSPST